MEQIGDERASRVIWAEAKLGPKEPFSAALRSAGVEKPTDLPRGMVIATARLKTTHPTDNARLFGL